MNKQPFTNKTNPLPFLLTIGIGFFLLLIGLPHIAGLCLVACDRSETKLKTFTSSETAVSEVTETLSSQSSPAMVGVDDEQPATRPWTIVYVLKTMPSPKFPYWYAVKQGAESAAQDFGVNLRVEGPDAAEVDESCKEKQIALIAQLIEEGGIDGMVVGPLDSVKVAPVVERAIARGIPVIAFGTAINSDKLLTFLSIDNIKGGHVIGKWVVQHLEGGEGNVLILDGPVSQQNALDRRNAMLGGLSTGNVKVLDVQAANWDQVRAEEIVQKWVQTYPKIDAIMAVNDRMAAGAAAALVKLDRQDIMVTGYGGFPIGLDGIQSGTIAATIDQLPALQSRRAMQLLIQHLETGKTFNPHLPWQDIQIISSANITNYLPTQKDK